VPPAPFQFLKGPRAASSAQNWRRLALAAGYLWSQSWMVVNCWGRRL